MENEDIEIMGSDSGNSDGISLNIDGHSIPSPKKRKIFFGKNINQSTIESLSEKIININDDDRFLEKLYKLHDLNYKPKPITIYIDSYGGNVYQIFGLLAIMERSKTPIHTICTGAAMSAGFMLLIFGHKRFAYEMSTMMYHQVGSVTGGAVEDMKQYVVEAERLQDKMEEFTIRKTKIPKKKIDKVRKEKLDWYIDAVEAKNLGIIDEII